MNSYQKAKEKTREKAIQWQFEFTEHNYSWFELFQWQEYFYKQAKKYGLVNEFRENDII